MTARDQYRWARRFGYPRWQSVLKAFMVWRPSRKGRVRTVSEEAIRRLRNRGASEDLIRAARGGR